MVLRLPLLCIVLAGVGVSAADRIERVGRGSLLVGIPQGVKTAPREMYRTAAVKGPMPTTDWWTSLAWEPFSQNQFPHPLAVRAAAEGLRVCYAGAGFHATAKHIFASFRDEVTLGHAGCRSFPDARVGGYSDWFVTAHFEKGKDRMRLTYGHGSPFVFGMFEGGGAAVTFKGVVTVWAGNERTGTLGVSVNGRHYGLFGSATSTWSGMGSATLVNENRGKEYFSLAILPDNRPATLELYDVPVTSDFDKTTQNGQEDFTPLFLGAEQVDVQSHAEPLVANHLSRMKRDRVNVKTITCVSTTCANYADRETQASRSLAHIIDTVRRLADEHGLEFAPATLKEIHEEADRLYRLGKHS